MSILIWSLVFVASLTVLVWAAGVFIRSAEAIGLRAGLSPFIIGITLVAFGTSFPELVAGIVSVFQGASEIAVGTAVGSNVTNILLILGLAAAVGRGLRVDYEVIRVDLPFLFGSALALWLFGHDGAVGALEGLVGLAALGAYIAYAASSPEEPETAVAVTATEVAPELPPEKQPLPRKTWVALALSALFTQVGAHFTVESVIRLSEIANVGREILATTAVALGTSLPELVVSVRSAAAGKPEIAVGNVIGSNIFNALGVVGVSALFGTLTVPASLSGFAMPAMVGVTILGFFVLQEREMTRWDGWLLLALYLGFLIQVLRLG